MKIKIIAIGKLDSEVQKLFDEYQKRLGSFCKVETLFLKEDKNRQNNEQKVLEKSKSAFLIIFDEKGKEFTSQEFANFLEQKENQSVGEIVFFIGGTDGHTDFIKQNADFKLSLSKLTLPHKLACLFAVESIYRAFSIINHHPYHRE
ncbi:23S rRNA (pseudouridine(1915)-N(3))-methyltransferase RlmH [Candidatus Campbellbacteria bacterium]|nr:MAG: 23S rRNA (pseudouridine(1915)-N(3))-methyltransferase RlmH [Candidatus Campbellbacteria bacterium]